MRILRYFILLLKKYRHWFCHIKIIKKEFFLLKMTVTIDFVLCMYYAD